MSKERGRDIYIGLSCTNKQVTLAYIFIAQLFQYGHWAIGTR